MAAATEGGLSAELLANPTLVRDPGLTAAQIDVLVRNERLAEAWVATGDDSGMREQWASAPLHGGFPVTLVEEPHPGVPLGWTPLGWETAVRHCVGRIGDGVLIEAATRSATALLRSVAMLDEAPGLRQGIRIPTHRCREIVVDVVARSTVGEGTLEVLLRRRAPGAGEHGGEVGEVLARSTVTVGDGAWRATQHRLEVPDSLAPVELVDLFVRWHGSRTNGPSTAAHLLVDRVSAVPADHIEGFDPDVLAVAKAARISEVRWPGGNFASHYHWRDGIGPVELRPTRPNFSWGGIEQNTIGTEEFLTFCRLIGAQPHLTVNSGTGNAQEAAAWVEYCNGPVDTPMGALRAAGGHPEPHDVRVWEVGNENFGNWQGGFVGSEENARRFAEFAPAMRAVSPMPLEVHACGNLFDVVGANKPLDAVDHDGRWHTELIRRAPDDLDVVSLHALPVNDRYLDGLSEQDVHHALMAYPVSLERTILPDLFAECDASDRDPARGPVRVSMTEWGPVGARNDRVRCENAGGGLWGFDLLGVLTRFGSRIAMASPNGLLHGGSIKKGAGIVFTDPLFDCVVRMRELVGQVPVAVRTEGPTFNVEHPTDLGLPEVDVPTVGVSATMSFAAGSSDAGERGLTCILVSRRLTGSDVVHVSVPGQLTQMDPAAVSVSAWRPTSVGVFATPSNPTPVRWVPIEPRWQAGDLVVEVPAITAVWIGIAWSG
jgi:alpha-N-arabinofuranosidase